MTMHGRDFVKLSSGILLLTSTGLFTWMRKVREVQAPVGEELGAYKATYERLEHAGDFNWLAGVREERVVQVPVVHEKDLSFARHNEIVNAIARDKPLGQDRIFVHSLEPVRA